MVPFHSSAINGPQLIGFSAESTALAGAGHVAIADTSAMNTNPAALSLIQGTRFDFTAGALQAFLHHSDVFGNNKVAGQNNVYALGNLGFATRFPSVPGLTVGAGLFTQGGFGTEYRNLMTAFGTHNDTFSFFRYSKFAVALSYEATEKLSVGIAPSVGYAKETLSPLAPLILEHLLTGGFGFRFTEKVSFDLGAVYGFKNTVTYTNTSLPFGPHSHRINECLLCLYHPQL